MTISIYSKEIEIFLSLCETKSLKTTAEHFDLSVSATSRQIINLEKSLGVSLFDRTTRPMSLTPNGRDFCHELKPGFTRANSLVKSMQARNAIRPSLRIGIVDSLTYSLAPEFIRKIRPRVSRITCLTGTSDSLLQRLIDEELDIILTASPAESIPNLRRLLFLKEPSIVILPKSFEKSYASNLSWAKLSLIGLPYIEPHTKSGSGLLTNNFLKTQGLKFYGNLTADNMGLKLKLVAQGLGWFISRSVGFLNHVDIIDDVAIMPVPPPGFCRRVYLLSSEKISRELYIDVFNTLVSSMREVVLPKVWEHFPWTKEETVLAKEQKI